jgi:hypothetical protein
MLQWTPSLKNTLNAYIFMLHKMKEISQEMLECQMLIKVHSIEMKPYGMYLEKSTPQVGRRQGMEKYIR